MPSRRSVEWRSKGKAEDHKERGGSADFSGFLIIDGPLVYSDPAIESPLQNLPADYGAWLSTVPGFVVDSKAAISVDNLNGTEYKSHFTPRPEGPAKVRLYSVGSFGFVPVPFGPLPNPVYQAVLFTAGTHQLLMGFGGGTADPTPAFKDLVVAVTAK